MDQLKAMRVFARVVDEGSFARAARALDLAPAVVTRLIAELEGHLGARLLNRTTRRIALTDIGEAYLERSRQILIQVEEAEALASEATNEPRGHLRVLAPPAIVVHQLADQLPRFHDLYPKVTLELATPGPVEAIDESFDVSILLMRKPLDGDFVATVLARTEVILCASPSYLDRRGRPEHPSELALHDALIPPNSEVQRGLTLHHARTGEACPLVPLRRALLTTNHSDSTLAAATAGLGIGGLPTFMIGDALLARRLERVLPEWRVFSNTIWAARPTRKHVPARTRVFLDFLNGIFGGADRDPWLAAVGLDTTGLREAA